MTLINGKDITLTNISVKDYLLQNNYDLSKIAVELNEEILPKSEYESTIIGESDVLEVVSFVGGG